MNPKKKRLKSSRKSGSLDADEAGMDVSISAAADDGGDGSGGADESLIAAALPFNWVEGAATQSSVSTSSSAESQPPPAPPCKVCEAGEAEASDTDGADSAGHTSEVSHASSDLGVSEHTAPEPGTSTTDEKTFAFRKAKSHSLNEPAVTGGRRVLG